MNAIEARPRRRRPPGGMRRALACGLAAAWALALPAAASNPFLEPSVTVRVVQEVGPAVVNITTERTVTRRGYRPFGDPFFDQFFHDFFEPRFPQTAQSLGSGVIIDAQGHILTNEHVVAQADRIRVMLADGRELDAELIGADPNNDIAVLQAHSEEKLPWLPMGTSDDLLVGESVIAIGNPFGLSNTVTTGVISALNRSIRSEKSVYHGFLQTDASINPGNSGGPLMDAGGELIGINTAVYQGGQGIGFAIPIDVARRVVHELIEHGEVTPVWLGIGFQDLDPGLYEAMKLPAGLRGALVNRVREKSPALRAGILRGDVVTRVDEFPIASARSFFEVLETATKGQELELELWREGALQTRQVQAEEVPDELARTLLSEALGLELRLLEGGGCEVRAVRAGSGSARIGIQAGDVLLGINGRALQDEEALRRSGLELRGRSQALVVVRRGGGRYHVTIPLA